MRRYIEQALITAVIAGLLYMPSVVRLQQLKNRDRDLSLKLEQISQQNHVLAEENEMLQHDPEYIEAVAREKLKVAKKNEIIIRVIDAPAAGKPHAGECDSVGPRSVTSDADPVINQKHGERVERPAVAQ